jgi:adenylyl-sulfate kinase
VCYVLDGDNVRQGLNRDLGFSPDDRRENIRRVAEVARMLNDAGLVVITAFISPYREDREMARRIIGRERFLETYLTADLTTCERRDPKGLYRKARAGAIADFTGIDAPYEAPDAPDLMLESGTQEVSECLDAALQVVLQRIQPR